MAVKATKADGEIVPIDNELVSEITVSLGRTWNLPKIDPNNKYEKQESVTLHVSAKLNRYPGQDPYEVFLVGKKLVEDEITVFHKETKKKGDPLPAQLTLRAVNSYPCSYPLCTDLIVDEASIDTYCAYHKTLDETTLKTQGTNHIRSIKNS